MQAIVESEEISIILDKDEALVLLEWLGRFNKADHPSLFQDSSEQRILYDLEAVLETVVSETFDPGYGEALEAARRRLRDE